MFSVQLQKKIISQIEAIIHEDVGRNTSLLFRSTQGELYHAAQKITCSKKPIIGIITGFYIPTGNPPACETDGPIGAALIISALNEVGVQCKLMTDKMCKQACEAALHGAGLKASIDVVANHNSIEFARNKWETDGVTHVISIERCGLTRDGTLRNMKGVDISHYTLPLDIVFLGNKWEKIAIGDGGNEIGMGFLPDKIVSDNIALGETIRCITPADTLIVAGVSNWGAYALLGALGILRNEWKNSILDTLTVKKHMSILKAMLKNGPAVDGVTREQTLSVDGLPARKHNEILQSIRLLLERTVL